MQTKDTKQIRDNVVNVTAAPDHSAETVTQFLFGECIDVLSDKDTANDDFVYCRSHLDFYEGYVPRCALNDNITLPTHKISSIRCFVYESPDFKSHPLQLLSFQSLVSIKREQNGYGELANGGWVSNHDLSVLDVYEADLTDTALKFLHTPYLWGGRTSLGIDCSALLQLSLAAIGVVCPRDTKDQISGLEDHSHDLAPTGAPLQRGDIIFFDGHVGIMVNESEILNATARHMRVCIETLSDVAKEYGGMTAMRRLTL